MRHLERVVPAGIFVAMLGGASLAGCGAGTSADSTALNDSASSSSATSVGAGKHEFKARLIGFQETPAISTPGHGTFRATLSDDQSTVMFELTYADLKGVDAEGAPTLAHVHLGQRGVAGGVAVFLCGGGGRPACPKQPATVTGTISAADVVGPTAQGIDPGGLADLIAAARAGVTYVNVHTARFPSGEIRGQIRGHRDRDGDRDHD